MELSAKLQDLLQKKSFALTQELSDASGVDPISIKKFMITYGIRNPLQTIFSASIYHSSHQYLETGIMTMAELLKKKNQGPKNQIIDIKPIGILETGFPIQQFMEQIRIKPTQKQGKFMQREIVSKNKNNPMMDSKKSNIIQKKPQKKAEKSQTTIKDKNNGKNAMTKKVQSQPIQKQLTREKLPRLNSDKEGNRIISQPKPQPIKQSLKVKYSTSDEEGGELDEQVAKQEKKNNYEKMEEEAKQKVQKMNIEEDEDQEQFAKFLAKQNKNKTENNSTNMAVQKNEKSTADKPQSQIQKDKPKPVINTAKPSNGGNLTLNSFWKKKIQ